MIFLTIDVDPAQRVDSSVAQTKISRREEQREILSALQDVSTGRVERPSNVLVIKVLPGMESQFEDILRRASHLSAPR